MGLVVAVQAILGIKVDILAYALEVRELFWGGWRSLCSKLRDVRLKKKGSEGLPSPTKPTVVNHSRLTAIHEMRRLDCCNPVWREFWIGGPSVGDLHRSPEPFRNARDTVTLLWYYVYSYLSGRGNLVLYMYVISIHIIYMYIISMYVMSMYMISHMAYHISAIVVEWMSYVGGLSVAVPIRVLLVLLVRSKYWC